jgi:hypothetical protein
MSLLEKSQLLTQSRTLLMTKGKRQIGPRHQALSDQSDKADSLTPT